MTVVIVLGGHRCGTSSVAGVLSRLGFPAALPGDEIGASPSNPRGHFEDAMLCRMHERMLGRGGWRDPAPPVAMPAQVRSRYVEHLRRRAGAAQRWCVKDPRLCLLLPVLIESLRECAIGARMVSVFRPVESAAESLRRRQRMSREAAGRIAWLYEGARRAQVAWVHSATDMPVLGVEYDALLSDPGEGVQRIAEFVGVGATAEAVAFLEPGLRHC